MIYFLVILDTKLNALMQREAFDGLASAGKCRKREQDMIWSLSASCIWYLLVMGT